MGLIRPPRHAQTDKVTIKRQSVLRLGTYSRSMTNWAHLTPEFLREEAERSFRSAASTLDAAIHDALVACGQELLDRARRMEVAASALALGKVHENGGQAPIEPFSIRRSA